MNPFESIFSFIGTIIILVVCFEGIEAIVLAWKSGEKKEEE